MTSRRLPELQRPPIPSDAINEPAKRDDNDEHSGATTPDNEPGTTALDLKVKTKTEATHQKKKPGYIRASCS